LKLIFSILLAFNLFAAGIFPGAEKEWAKLPQLFEHYGEHQKEADAEMSFLDFLFLHYYTEHGACGHSDLPHCCHSGSILTYIPSYSTLVSFDIFVLEASFRKENYSFNYYFNLINSLFQPPQGTIFKY
jgi:hypothetical protein